MERAVLEPTQQEQRHQAPEEQAGNETDDLPERPHPPPPPIRKKRKNAFRNRPIAVKNARIAFMGNLHHHNDVDTGKVPSVYLIPEQDQATPWRERCTGT